MLCAVSDESGVTQALPNCLSFFSSSFILFPHVSAPLGEYEYTTPFQQDSADDDATWHDATDNATSQRRHGYSRWVAGHGAYIPIRLPCWRMFSVPT